MSGAAVGKHKLSPCAGAAGKICGCGYSVGDYCKAFPGSRKALNALNGYPASTCAVYMSAAGDKEICKAGYLRLSCAVGDNSFALCGDSRQQNIFRCSHRWE